MNRGPKPGRASNGDDRTFVEKATEAWAVLPEWVGELASAADVRGLKGAAEAIGYSTSLVSTVLGNKYSGDVGRVEEKVNGALMGVTVMCPRLDEMARNVCLDWQKKPFAAASSLRVEMYHACRGGCPHSRIKKGGGDVR